MNRLLLILILTFSFQTFSKANDVRDFEIEGFGVGESLLDYVNQKKIKKSFYPKSKKYVRSWHNNLIDSSDYNGFQFHYKPNDKNFIIHGLSGYIYFYNDMKACLKKQKTIISELDKLFINKKIPTSKLKKHPSDPTGKSFYTYTSYKLDDGVISLECTDWSKTLTSNKNWQDNLSVHIKTKKFSDWLDFEAY